MNGKRVRSIFIGLVCVLLAGGLLDDANAQPKPEGEMRWALYVTLSPVWFDPGEVLGIITPFWVLYAIHDTVRISTSIGGRPADQAREVVADGTLAPRCQAERQNEEWSSRSSGTLKCANGFVTRSAGRVVIEGWPHSLRSVDVMDSSRSGLGVRRAARSG